METLVLIGFMVFFAAAIYQYLRFVKFVVITACEIILKILK